MVRYKRCFISLQIKQKMKMQTAFCGLLLLTTISVATTQMLRWTWEPPSPPPSTNEGANFEQPNTLDEAIHEHRRICTRHHTCTGKMYSVGSFCCGSCTCDIKCAEHGSCCPEMFRNFAQAHDFIQKSRFVHMCIYTPRIQTMGVYCFQVVRHSVVP